MSGVNYLIDDHGKKTAVIIDLKTHGELWEDFMDSLISRQRKGEPRESLESVRRSLKRKHSSHA